MEIIDVKTKEDLKNFLIESNNGSNIFFKEGYFKKIFPDFYSKIIDFNLSNINCELKFTQKIYHYIYDLKEYPKCTVCGKDILRFKSFKSGYCSCCSIECSSKNPNRIKKISTSHINRDIADIEISNKKREETCLKKYNATNVSKTDEVKNKIQNSLLNRTEEEKALTTKKLQNAWFSKSQEEIDCILEKRKETNSKKTEEEKRKIYEKNLKTRIENCGSLYESYRMSYNKSKETINEKYGVDNYFQMDSVIEISKKRWDKYRQEKFENVIEYIKETDTYICKCCDENCNLCKNKTYTITTHNYLNRIRYGYDIGDICTIKNPIGEYKGKSKLQEQIFEYIKTIYDGVVIFNCRDLLINVCDKKIEIDIYIPEKNIAFEINGDFWHMNPKLYNENDINEKTNESAKEIWDRDEYKKQICESVHICFNVVWEYDWKNNNEYIKEKIKNILNQ